MKINNICATFYHHSKCNVANRSVTFVITSNLLSMLRKLYWFSHFITDFFGTPFQDLPFYSLPKISTKKNLFAEYSSKRPQIVNQFFQLGKSFKHCDRINRSLWPDCPLPSLDLPHINFLWPLLYPCHHHCLRHYHCQHHHHCNLCHRLAIVIIMLS